MCDSETSTLVRHPSRSQLVHLPPLSPEDIHLEVVVPVRVELFPVSLSALGFAKKVCETIWFLPVSIADIGQIMLRVVVGERFLFCLLHNIDRQYFLYN